MVIDQIRCCSSICIILLFSIMVYVLVNIYRAKRKLFINNGMIGQNIVIVLFPMYYGDLQGRKGCHLVPKYFELTKVNSAGSCSLTMTSPW